MRLLLIAGRVAVCLPAVSHGPWPAARRPRVRTTRLDVAVQAVGFRRGGTMAVMRAVILTGTPGSGKTAILRQLEANGHPVVEEAATDVIALGQALGDRRPWETPGFAERILDLQRHRRRIAAAYERELVFFDRSPVCTLALCRYAGLPAPEGLLAAIDGYERRAFLVRNLGFVEPTAARRITFEQSIAFERIHEETYRELGFDLVEVPPAALTERTELIESVARVRP